MKPSVLILTYNSSLSIEKTLSGVQSISDDIHVVDSGSTDGTLSILEAHHVRVYHRAFTTYGDQRNWLIHNASTRYSWQLHLDADEWLTPELQQEIRLLPDDPGVDGFFLKRYLKFLGRVLRWNLAPTWHMRLFRGGKGHCEDREYDQHFYCDGSTSTLNETMIDDIQMSLSEWTARHNRWSDAEVKEYQAAAKSNRIAGDLQGNVVQRKRAYRSYYDRAPFMLRALLLFLYRYLLRGGFMDGVEGLIFCVLQTFWFRFLVDSKLIESRLAPRTPVRE